MSIFFEADNMEKTRKIPLVKPYLPNLKDIEPYLQTILESGRLTNFGRYSKLLEERICEYIGVTYALCVSNATTGLTLLLNSLPKGSEVLVPSFTFLPTVQAILWNSLIPVFIDIDDSYTISPQKVKSHISSKTSAILGVHAFGNPCAIEELENLAKQYGVKLFFDSAHAFGAKYQGKYIGGLGDAEVFSFSVTKILPCGEGGAITTNNVEIYQLILNRRNYGFTYGSYDCVNRGLNGKITEFSAILGLLGIDFDEGGVRRIDTRVNKRNEIASKYLDRLSRLSGLTFQEVRNNNTSTYKDFTITIEPQLFGTQKNIVREKLHRKGIETASYFSPAIHQLTYFQQHFPTERTNLEYTNRIESGILSLPIYFDMTDEEFEYVVSTIEEIYFDSQI